MLVKLYLKSEANHRDHEISSHSTSFQHPCNLLHRWRSRRPNALAFRPIGAGFAIRIPAMPLFYWVATIYGQVVYTHCPLPSLLSSKKLMG